MQWLEEARGSALGLGGLALAMIAGFWAWLKTRPSRAQDDAALMTGAAAFQNALATQSRVFADTMDTLVSRQAEHMAAQDRRIKALEDENEQCRGENRQLHQRVDSLVHALIRAGVAVPQPMTTGPALELDARSGLTEPPARKPRRPRRPRSSKE